MTNAERILRKHTRSEGIWKEDSVLAAMEEYVRDCMQKLKGEVYVVIDTDQSKYDDIVLGIYESAQDAASVQMVYEDTVAIKDENRFKILTEKIL